MSAANKTPVNREEKQVTKKPIDRCDACGRFLSLERYTWALRQPNGSYKKVMLEGGVSGRAAFLCPDCALKHGIVYADDDW